MAGLSGLPTPRYAALSKPVRFCTNVRVTLNPSVFASSRNSASDASNSASLTPGKCNGAAVEQQQQVRAHHAVGKVSGPDLVRFRFRSAVNAHHGCAGPPAMKRVTERKTSSKQGS